MACQATYDLAPQDAIIYAAVLVDLDRQPADPDKCFVSRNWKDFGDPGIRAELRARNCQYEETFEGGLAFIRDVGLGM